jgi:hypothetical protein
MDKFMFDCIGTKGSLVTRIEMYATNYWSAKIKMQLYYPGYVDYIYVDENDDNWSSNPNIINDGRGNEYDQQGLRYVSEEVGYVDQDEEYY